MSETQRILILGAGIYQVPLIVAAQRRGLMTIVASRPGPYPGINIADQFEPVDISNEEGILAIARQHKITAVVTAGADAGLPALGRVVDELGLPGPGEVAAYRSANKASMKAAFISGEVPSARFGVFNEAGPAHEFAVILGYPVMVKPSDSSGSRGVIRVDNDSDFVNAWPEAHSHSRVGLVIVERCLVGREYGAQAIVHGQEVVAVLIHDDLVIGAPISTPVAHAMPAQLTAAEVTATEHVVATAVAAVGLRDCVANVDLMLTDEGPQVIEIGGRMGATGIPEMINLYTGWDIYDHVLDLALGTAAPLPAPLARPNAVTLLRSESAGTILSLEIPAEIRNHPDLVACHWDIKPGDEVAAFRVGPDRLGQLQVAAETGAAAMALAEELRTKIRIEVQEKS